MSKIEETMEQVGTPTLKALALVFGLPAIRLYTVAKQPKPGEVYDAHVYNWDAIERFVTRRLPLEDGPQTIEEVIQKALKIDEELKTQDGRRTTTTASGKKITVDGKEVPERKYPNFNIEARQPIVLKKDPMVYGIIYQTLSHTVLRPVNRDDQYCSDEVKVVSNIMMNFRGTPEDMLSAACEERWSGKFAEKLAADAAKVTDADVTKLPTPTEAAAPAKAGTRS